MIKRKLKVFVGKRQTARRIRLAITEQTNENSNEVTDNPPDIKRHNVDQASGINVLDNSDAEIVDYDVLDGDCEDSDESLSLELGARTSTDEESIDDSDLSDTSDAFDFDYEGSNCDATDFDVESVSDDGQEKDPFYWDYFEGNDNLWENKERQELFRSRLSHWVVETNVPRSSVDKLLAVLRTEKVFSFLSKSYKTLLKTKRKVNTIEVNPGRYYAFNVLDVIKSSLASIDVHFESPEVVLKMYVGIDGLPSSKSTNSQFWPILGRLKLAGACVYSPWGFIMGNQNLRTLMITYIIFSLKFLN